MALAIASWLEWLFLYWLYVLRTGSAARALRDLHAIARIAAAAAAMALFLGVALPAFDERGMAASWVTVLAGAVAGVAVYVAAAILLRVEEVAEARNRLRALLGPG